MGNVCERYIDAKGWLECGVILGALQTFSRRQHFCFMDSDLALGLDVTLEGAHRVFVRSALSGLSQWNSFVEMPKELGMDVSIPLESQRSIC